MEESRGVRRGATGGKGRMGEGERGENKESPGWKRSERNAYLRGKP